MELNVNALAQSLNTQAVMGMLLTKVLGQTEELIKQQATVNIQNAEVVPAPVEEGVGESVDVVA